MLRILVNDFTVKRFAILDADYYIQKLHNCALINLEDMLQNGTVLNGTMIEKPHSFATACNIATQVAALVTGSQYGYL